MRPAFALLRHVERRTSNATVTEKHGNTITQTKNHYSIMVTRLVLFWVTVWTTETEWT